jgi:hypothetical protein
MQAEVASGHFHARGGGLPSLSSSGSGGKEEGLHIPWESDNSNLISDSLLYLSRLSISSPNEGNQLLGLAFCVVQSVNTKDNLLRLCQFEEPGRRFCQLHEAVEGYTNGQRLDVDRATRQLHKHVVTIHSASQASRAAVNEVEAVVLNVEAHHVTSLYKKS